MSTLTRSIRSFLRAEDGATTAEYGIIIVVVAGIAIFVLSQLNGALSTLYGNFQNKVTTVT
jgi:Flp pilus assembly pilin Flp